MRTVFLGGYWVIADEFLLTFPLIDNINTESIFFWTRTTDRDYKSYEMYCHNILKTELAKAKEANEQLFILTHSTGVSVFETFIFNESQASQVHAVLHVAPAYNVTLPVFGPFNSGCLSRLRTLYLDRNTAPYIKLAFTTQLRNEIPVSREIVLPCRHSKETKIVPNILRTMKTKDVASYLIRHSETFLNNIKTNIIDFTNKGCVNKLFFVFGGNDTIVDPEASTEHVIETYPNAKRRDYPYMSHEPGQAYWREILDWDLIDLGFSNQNA